MSSSVSQKVIDDLILDLSLASSLPIGLDGRNFTHAASAANTFAYYTSKMRPKELKQLEYAIGPLLILIQADIDNPVAAKAALGNSLTSFIIIFCTATLKSGINNIRTSNFNVKPILHSSIYGTRWAFSNKQNI